MRKLVDIDLLEDESLQAHMAMGSLWIVLVGLLLGLLGAVMLPHESLSPWWFVLLVSISVAVLPVHELVHALAFKVVSFGRARVRFGFAGWMLYTMSPGTRLGRRAFCAVLLAPAFFVTTCFGVVGAFMGWPLLGWCLAVIHLAGCTGDIGYVRIIASEPQASLVEDTERGITLFCGD